MHGTALQLRCNKVDDFEGLLTHTACDVVRTRLAAIGLDKAAFLMRHEVIKAVKAKLAAAVAEYGYEVKDVLLTRFLPAAAVVREMNDIYAQALGRQVAVQLAAAQKECQYILSKADRERRALLGKGVSLMRRAYVDGLAECIAEFADRVSGLAPTSNGSDRAAGPRRSRRFILTFDDVLFVQLALQHFDALRAAAAAHAAAPSSRGGSGGGAPPRLLLSVDAARAIGAMKEGLRHVGSFSDVGAEDEGGGGGAPKSRTKALPPGRKAANPPPRAPPPPSSRRQSPGPAPRPPGAPGALRLRAVGGSGGGKGAAPATPPPRGKGASAASKSNSRSSSSSPVRSPGSSEGRAVGGLTRRVSSSSASKKVAAANSTRRSRDSWPSALPGLGGKKAMARPGGSLGRSLAPKGERI